MRLRKPLCRYRKEPNGKAGICKASSAGAALANELRFWRQEKQPMRSIMIGVPLCGLIVLTAGPAHAEEKLKAAELQQVVAKIVRDVQPAVVRLTLEKKLTVAAERLFPLTV
jgi:hypothetical protein